jgi:hypothetical protein
MPNDVSLSIGDLLVEKNKDFESTRFARKAVLTGDPLSKSGALRAGVFMDEYF